jgi:hypothetical protein
VITHLLRSRARRAVVGLAVAAAGLLGGHTAVPAPAAAETAGTSLDGVVIHYVTPDVDGTVDLAALVDDTILDTVYAIVPSPYGPVEFVIEALEANEVAVTAIEGQHHSSSPCNESARRNSSVVWGGANPPKHYVWYNDRTGARSSYVEGDARIKSCMEQDMLISVQQMVGMSVFKSTGQLRVRVPGARWVTIYSPQMKCETSSGKRGYAYRTYVETYYRTMLGGGSANWSSTSEERWWAYC